LPGGLKVQRDAALAAIVGPEIRLIAAQIPAAKRIAAFGIFHFNDFGAHIGEQHRAVGARNKIAQLQNFDAF
jgi:hypothetical protein